MLIVTSDMFVCIKNENLCSEKNISKEEHTKQKSIQEGIKTFTLDLKSSLIHYDLK